MKKGYTAQEAASFLLGGTDLSEWQIGFLAVALDEVAEWHERIGKTGSIACQPMVMWSTWANKSTDKEN